MFEIVGEASDGLEAVEMCAEEQPDVVLIDLAMPTMDGLQAIPKILADSPGTKVIVLSGFSRVQVEQKALAAGASAYLEKGEAPSRIVATILDVIGGRAPAALGSTTN
jgi:YesN/AraC family two-component response regulator